MTDTPTSAPAAKPHGAGTSALRLVTAEDYASRSGLEILREILASGRDGTPFSALIDMEMHSIEPGHAVFHGRPGPQHFNLMGGVHGGWYGAIMDSALGCAVMSSVPAGRYWTTLDYHINILRAISPGTEVECEGMLQHGGRSTAVARGEIRDLATGRLYATGSTTCMIMDVR